VLAASFQGFVVAEVMPMAHDWSMVSMKRPASIRPVVEPQCSTTSGIGIAR
jgi:hypothetical protein